MVARRGVDAASAPRRSSEAASAEAADGEQLLVDAIAALHGNGAGSERSEERAAQLEAALGVEGRLDLGWNTSSIDLEARALSSLDTAASVPLDQPRTTLRFAATPSAVAMNRVLAVDRAINEFSSSTTTLATARKAVAQAATLKPANIFLFAAACAVGASCLAIIFGIHHVQTVLLIAASSVAGAFLRRGIGRLGGSNFWQVGVAALLAGLLGAIATNSDISSSLRLAAVCPCMILVPGPHLLNGSLDLAALRIPLGLARLTFATLTLLSIAAGLLAGLTLGGAELVVDPAGRDIPLWLDAGAAGIVAVCYGIFYSAPLRILIWPFAVGAAVHALRWVALDIWHLESYVGAGLACLVAATILLPVSRRFQLPFSAIGFASVVSLMPGVLIFRSLAGLAQLQTATGTTAEHLLVSTINDANVAWLTVFAMAIGFILPAGVYGWIRHRSARSLSAPTSKETAR
ncbi:threonine/serine exporter family protein [Agreia sp. VKM Ac-1783]|uniref:threonine/serine exporter family protein n=1 Tax=Agreia sp. VKM Ac-1783 TaxID=1938889 RepID=UPI000A2AA842|nr:threonine/serine exporter family protein [Agreia sp. VKM Ac-1783]SMQ73753.1 Uncharacterized membrane protein YjjP, DUF1212 family [Agreia sp. VKM Ac-1783]